MSEVIDTVIADMQAYLDDGTVSWEVDETGCLRLFKSACTKNSVKPTETAHVARVGKVIEIDGVEYHMEHGSASPNDCIQCANQVGTKSKKLCAICLNGDWMCVKIVKPTTDEGEK